MLNAAQKLTIAVACLIVVAMRLYPPFTDASGFLPEPMYALVNQPPLGANNGNSITILWEVLIVQWAIVFTVALGLCLTFRAGEQLAPLQTIALWGGIGSIVAILLFPPYHIGSGGPFGFPILRFKFLFQPESYTTMDKSLLVIEVSGAILVTISAVIMANKRVSRHPKIHLPG